MPFKSKAQRRYMHSQHPEVAQRWEKKYKTKKNLPEHVKKAAINSIACILRSYFNKLK